MNISIIADFAAINGFAGAVLASSIPNIPIISIISDLIDDWDDDDDDDWDDDWDD